MKLKLQAVHYVLVVIVGEFISFSQTCIALPDSKKKKVKKKDNCVHSSVLD